MAAPLTYLALLALTLLIETPLAAALAGRARRRDVACASLALNLATHPLATGLVWLAGAPWLAVESAVVIAEALGLHSLAALGARRALVVSLSSNALSALAGLALAQV
jgi:hypothetical protein